MIRSIRIRSSSLRRLSFGKLPGLLRIGCSKSSISLTVMQAMDGETVSQKGDPAHTDATAH